MIRTIDQAFNELIARQALTYQQQQTAEARVGTISAFLTREFLLAETPFVTGSYARNTICGGDRDIDIISPFSSDYWQRYRSRSRDFLYWVRDSLNDRYAATDVSSKQVAVTLDFTTIKVDLVPAFVRSGGDYLIPDGNNGWQSTNPKYHTQLVHNAHINHGQRLKPLIKLAKKWNNANGHHLTSFHMEFMVERMWRDAANIPAWPDAMRKTLATLPSWIDSSFPDPWDSSRNIDTYLSTASKGQVLRMLSQDARNSEEAEDLRIRGRVREAFEKWDIVFGRTFPAQVY